MILARIVGTVVATRKDPRLVSNKLLLARAVDPRDRSRLEGGYLVVGSPETVAEQLADRIRITGAGNLVMFLQHGSLPLHLARKNYTLFAEQVMPLLKKEYPAGPTWAEAAVAV